MGGRGALLRREGKLKRQLWVRLGHCDISASSPLYPEEQTSISSSRRSALGPIAEKARDARSVKPACELFQPLPHKCVDAHLSVGWEGGGLRCVNKLLTVTFHVANDRGSRPDLIPRNINEVLDAVTMKFISTAVGCHRLVEIGALLLC